MTITGKGAKYGWQCTATTKTDKRIEIDDTTIQYIKTVILNHIQ